MTYRKLAEMALCASSLLAEGCSPPETLPYKPVFQFDLAIDPSELAVDPKGRQLVVGSVVDGLSVYAEPFGTAVTSPPEGPLAEDSGNLIVGAGLLDDGRLYLARRNVVEVWDARAHERLVQIPIPPDPQLPSLAARHIALEGSGRFVAVDEQVYDSEEKRWMPACPLHAAQSAVEFWDQQRMLTAGFHDQSVCVHPLRDEACKCLAAPDEVVAAHFLPGGNAAVFATTDELMTWSFEHSSASQAVGLGLGDARDMCVFADQVAVLTRGTWLTPSKLRVFGLAELDERPGVTLGGEGLALACGGDLAVAGDEHGVLYAYAADAGKLVGRAKVLDDRIDLVRVASKSERIVAVTNSSRGNPGVLVQIAR